MTKLNRPAYRKLIDENIEWLKKQPRTLERDHVVLIVEDSINWYYDPDPVWDSVPNPEWKVKITREPPLVADFAAVIAEDAQDTALNSRQTHGGYSGTHERNKWIVSAAALRDLRLTLRRPLMWASTREGLVARCATLLNLAGVTGNALYDVFRGPNGQVIGSSEILDSDWATLIRKRVVDILRDPSKEVP